MRTRAPRDPQLTLRTLQAWTSKVMPGFRLANVGYPHGNGFCNEIVFFDAVSETHVEKLVARIAPQDYTVYPEPRVEEQCRLIELLHRETNIPVPRIQRYERSASYFGVPFVVMERIEGRVPPDRPTYHHAGWVTEMSATERATMWWGVLKSMAELHTLDVTSGKFDFLNQRKLGAPGLEQRLRYYEQYLKWAYPGPQPNARAALQWLRANRPAEPQTVSVLWGDARLGNVILAGATPQAFLDWEMATLGQPEEDLAWFMFMDRYLSEGVGVLRLQGFPGCSDTISGYEKLIGRPLTDMNYYEILSAFKFSAIAARIGQLMIDHGSLSQASDWPHNNHATRLLARILEEQERRM